MDRRWWALPGALAALVVAACGAAAGQGAGPTSPTSTSPTSTPATSAPQSTVSPSGAAASTTPPYDALHAELDCAEGQAAAGFIYGLASMPPRPEPYGAASPEEAANSPGFGMQPQFRPESTTWSTVAAAPGSVVLGQRAQVMVDVIRLPDGSWYVISGQRCTAQP